MLQTKAAEAPSLPLTTSIDRARRLLFNLQSDEGYWWFTLEANETIGAGFICLMHFLGEVDPEVQSGLISRMLSQQREDGSWSLYYGGPGDLSTTIECYTALRLSGRLPSEAALERARRFILSQGGLTRCRVFTRIHLALFGLVPWSACPSMPVWFALLPSGGPVSIYDFCSWGRASIVPLLLIDAVRPIREAGFRLDELFVEPPDARRFSFPKPKGFLSLGNLFIQFERLLKLLERLPWHPGKRFAMRKAEKWVREHIERTEDIYPAMAYPIIALKALGYPGDDVTIRKALGGLKRFQQREGDVIHQQCCISPNWDTPWAGLALLEGGADPRDPRLLKAARYLISMEIRHFKGDWVHKNPRGSAGGWSFEFQNDYFPDVDDTIEAVHFLKKVGLPPAEARGPILRGLAWMLSMQSKNGGWAAFDKDNCSRWVNEIPFSDHGACLDPPTPDITGRMIELLSSFGYNKGHPVIRKALAFLKGSQEPDGSWRGRWGVNYIYGTWCVLQGLASLGRSGGPRETFGARNEVSGDKSFPKGQDPISQSAVSWIKSIQNPDGGWGESCASDAARHYVPLGVSTASQTAWAVMGLIAAGEGGSETVGRGIDWLIGSQQEDGGWDEPYYTGTGFPGHFYIRYHGYRYYFPLLALGRCTRGT